MVWLLLAIGCLAATGLAALLASRSPHGCTYIGVLGVLVAAALGLPTTLAGLTGQQVEPISYPWFPQLGGSFTIELDPLSALFLLLILVIGPVSAVYGGSYLLTGYRHRPLGPAWFFYNLLLASTILLVLAHNGLLFLFTWELMALSLYFLVIFEDDKESVCYAGWIYLIAAHLASACLIAFFLLLRRPGGSLDFKDFADPATHSAAFSGLLLVLALIGFGTKAGLVPTYVWLPEAHSAAPTHVSALMSAVLLKMGIYGLLRTLTLLGAPHPWWGVLLGLLGLLGGLLGIILAGQQRDLKRVLAYSSVENIGLITLALGLGVWGQAQQQPLVAALGFAGAVFHIVNHALMKGLLFLTAGSVLHGSGCRDVEQLGGLLKRMPWTGALMILGAVAISGLPPLNGFVGEWLMYLGLLTAGMVNQQSPELAAPALAAMFSVGILGMIGALAAICFVRLIGIVLLGQARSSAAEHAHESPAALLGPMGVLAALCLLIGVLPGAALTLLSGPINQLLGPATSPVDQQFQQGQVVSLTELGWCHLALWAVSGAGVMLWRLCLKNGVAHGGTWGCGYTCPTPRIQYTGRSFAQLLSEVMLPSFLRPRKRFRPPEGLFPTGGGEFEAASPDPLTEDVYRPFVRRVANGCLRLGWLQHGKLQLYLVYLLGILVLGLAWISVRSWWAG